MVVPVLSSKGPYNSLRSHLENHNRAQYSKFADLSLIATGPESLLWRPSMVAQDPDDMDNYYKHQKDDAVEQEDWKCIMTVNGKKRLGFRLSTSSRRCPSTFYPDLL